MKYVKLLKAWELDKLIKTIVFIKHGIGAVHELGDIFWKERCKNVK